MFPPVAPRPLVHPPGSHHIEILDQTRLPHVCETIRLESDAEVADAIRRMLLRGAPLIGTAAAFGLAMAIDRDPSDTGVEMVFERLIGTRPTAVNLRWALERVRAAVRALPLAQRSKGAWEEADRIANEDVAINRAIGEHGVALLDRAAAARAGRAVRVMTHCNAGALATVDWGTATAPLFLAHRQGMPLFVWVSETRPRLQGANLTAWEMRSRGIPHAIVPDAASAHLMQRGEVDLVLVGADRVTRTGDVCNKIGTLCKAIAAKEFGVPMYAGVPSPTIDWRIRDGVGEIPIEQRGSDEVLGVAGCLASGELVTIRIAPEGSAAVNPAFDVTPGRLLTGLITERGICPATEQGLRALFGEQAAAPTR